MSESRASQFAVRSRLGQLRLVRRALTALLATHRVSTDSLQLVDHGYNSTFRLGTEQGDFAIRININSTRTLEQVRGEVELVQQIASAGLTRVPLPQPIFQGSPMTLSIPGIAGPKPVVAYTWVEGRHQGDSPADWVRIGAALRGLQDSTTGLKLSSGAERPVFKDAIDSLPWTITDPALNEALAEANAVFLSLDTKPKQLLHYDLHTGNAKLHQGQLTVFDFDDSLWTHPAVDVAQTLYYVRRSRDPENSERAFWRGFGRSLDDLMVSPRQMEALVLGRSLLLTADFAMSMNPEISGYFDTQFRETKAAAERFLAKRKFNPRTE